MNRNEPENDPYIEDINNIDTKFNLENLIHENKSDVNNISEKIINNIKSESETDINNVNIKNSNINIKIKDSSINENVNNQKVSQAINQKLNKPSLNEKVPKTKNESCAYYDKISKPLIKKNSTSNTINSTVNSNDIKKNNENDKPLSEIIKEFSNEIPLYKSNILTDNQIDSKIQSLKFH